MKLSKTEQTIALLTLSLGKADSENLKPLSIREWNDLSSWLKINDFDPAQLLEERANNIVSNFQSQDGFVDRIDGLLNRGTTLAINLEKWERAGIWPCFRKSNDYPKLLRERLKKKTPPVIFCVGDITIADTSLIGMVGSRKPDDDDISFTEEFTNFVVKEGYNIVSGGAKGIDLKSSETALLAGAKSVIFVADSLLKYSVSGDLREYIQEGNLTLMSASYPEAGFNVGLAMQRNKFIYCLSQKTMIVTCTPDKGGTWAGAIENSKNKWVDMYVQQSDKKGSGNMKLIEHGAIPISNSEDAFYQFLSEKNEQVEPVVADEVSENLNDSGEILDYQDFLSKFEMLVADRFLPSNELLEQLSIKRKVLFEFLKQGIEEDKIKKKTSPVSYGLNIKKEEAQRELF